VYVLDTVPIRSRGNAKKKEKSSNTLEEAGALLKTILFKFSIRKQVNNKAFLPYFPFGRFHPAAWGGTA
jgi:hypothetical protein